MSKLWYPDSKIKKWFCEKCEEEIKGKKFATCEPSASYPHRKVYCEKCWKQS